MSFPWTAEELLPHAPPMILIDRIVSAGEDHAVAEVTVRAETPFHETGKGIPCHVAIEWMAQTCGAFAGIQAKRVGEPVRVGLLLGARAFHSRQDWFLAGQTFIVKAVEIYRDGEMGVFDCEVTRDQGLVADAQLTVFQPAELPADL